MFYDSNMPDNLSKVHERIRKLYTLQQDQAASQGEKDNCGILIEKLLVQYNLRIEQVVAGLNTLDYAEVIRKMQFEKIFAEYHPRNDAEKADKTDQERQRQERAKKARETEKNRKNNFRQDYFGDAWEILYKKYIFDEGTEPKKRIISLSLAETIEVCKWWNAGKSIGEMADKLDAHDSVVYDALIELGFQVEKPR